MNRYQPGVKSFCPLIIYHDNPSKQLLSRLNENETAIHHHRKKINEMLEANSHYWIKDYQHIHVSPSTSTISNMSSITTSSSEDNSIIMDNPKKKNIIVLQKSNEKKRRRGNLPKEVTEFLRKWLIQHKKHPYPAEKEKIDLARYTGLTVNQISNWFINARRRILQPMLESEQQQQQQEFHHYNSSRRKRFDFYDGSELSTNMNTYSLTNS